MVSTDTKYNSGDINNTIIIAIQVYYTLYLLQNDNISYNMRVTGDIYNTTQYSQKIQYTKKLNTQ